jgi:tRNA-dihydrouridine synthase 3
MMLMKPLVIRKMFSTVRIINHGNSSSHSSSSTAMIAFTENGHRKRNHRPRRLTLACLDGNLNTDSISTVVTTSEGEGFIDSTEDKTVTTVVGRTSTKPKHFDGRRERLRRPLLTTEEGEVIKAHTKQDRTRIQERTKGHLWLAPLTKGGNLPFRRLCAQFECKVLVSEMSYARFLNKGSPVEKAHLRRHETEKVFGAQIATNQIEEGLIAARMAYEFGADFVDLNCGCPTHEVTKRGLGANLLRKPQKLFRLVEGLASESLLPITVKIRLGIEDDKPALKLAEEIENAGASVLIVHGRTKDQRYTKAANWDLIGEIKSRANIPIVGNGDILTWYEARDKLELSNADGAMTGRGALIKPWIFQEFYENKSIEFTAKERIEFVYFRLTEYMKDYFGADKIGKKRYDLFFVWHIGFFCRYRPLDKNVYRERAKLNPLLQTRLDIALENEGNIDDLDPLERLLRCTSENAHVEIAEILWASETSEEAIEKLTLVANSLKLREFELEVSQSNSDRGGGGIDDRNNSNSRSSQTRVENDDMRG